MGFENEKKICNHLNKKKFVELNENMQKFLQYMFENSLNDDNIIFCKRIKGRDKSDLIISTDDNSYGVSVKNGKGNSIHQESLEEFIYFIKNILGADEQIADIVRLFIWGDATLDGKGKKKDRMKADEFKRKYPHEVALVKNFLNSNKMNLIERFLINGSKSTCSPQFIYYGDFEEGRWADLETALKWLCKDQNEAKRAVFPIGKLTLQSWNRNKNSTRSEGKRGNIQIKWGSLKNDLLLMEDFYE